MTTNSPSTKSWADVEEEEDRKESSPQNSKKEEETKVVEPTIVRVPGLSRGGKIIIEQDDPNSPLYSVKSFEALNLKPELLKGIYDMKYNKPSRIQENSLPLILEPSCKNLIAQAQAGTGKTAAFTLCALSRSDPNLKAPQAMIVCPTRELSRQIVEVVQQLGKYTGLSIQWVVKDLKFPKIIESQIIIGTPGKILDLIQKRNINPSKIKVLIFDEADVMMEMSENQNNFAKGKTSGLGEQSIKIKNVLGKNTQILLFSATYKQEVREFAERLVPQPCVQIQLKKEELTLDNITQLYIDCKSDEQKIPILEDIYGHLTIGQSMIFVATRKTAGDLHRRMTEDGHAVSLLHAGEEMTGEARDKVIDDFREGKTRVLISTNVLARGIDILQVMLVINFDLPTDGLAKIDPQTYLHRIGRSGRFGRKGIAINFVSDSKSKRDLKVLEDYCKKPIKEFPADKIEDLERLLAEVREHDMKMEAMKASGQLKDEEEEDA